MSRMTYTKISTMKNFQNGVGKKISRNTGTENKNIKRTEKLSKLFSSLWIPQRN